MTSICMEVTPESLSHGPPHQGTHHRAGNVLLSPEPSMMPHDSRGHELKNTKSHKFCPN